MQCKNNGGLVLTILFAAALCSCGKSPSAFGPSYNAERVKRGISEIGPGWTRDDNNPRRDVETWISPEENAKTVPRRANKFLDIADGVIHSEQDCFISGRTASYTDADGITSNVEEYLGIKYSYDLEREGKDPWFRFYVGPGHIGDSHEMNAEQADDLLRTWHLPPMPKPTPPK